MQFAVTGVCTVTRPWRDLDEQRTHGPAVGHSDASFRGPAGHVWEIAH